MRESLLTTDAILAKYPHLTSLAKLVNIEVGNYSIWNFWWHRLGQAKLTETVTARKAELDKDPAFRAEKRKPTLVEVHAALRKAPPDRDTVDTGEELL